MLKNGRIGNYYALENVKKKGIIYLIVLSKFSF